MKKILLLFCCVVGIGLQSSANAYTVISDSVTTTTYATPVTYTTTTTPVTYTTTTPSVTYVSPVLVNPAPVYSSVYYSGRNLSFGINLGSSYYHYPRGRYWHYYPRHSHHHRHHGGHRGHHRR